MWLSYTPTIIDNFFDRLLCLMTPRTHGTTASWRPSFLLSSATGEVRIAEKCFVRIHLTPSVAVKHVLSLISHCEMWILLCFTTYIVFCLYFKFIFKYISCFSIDSDVCVRPDVAALPLLRTAAFYLILSVKDSVRMFAVGINTNMLAILNCSEVTLHMGDTGVSLNVAFC